jgi:predicted enzyme related to lactoylglutathione lyase
MTSIQPELWVENAREALDFYAAAFGATVLHLVGDGDEIVAQLGVGDAAFWVAPASSTMKRLDPRAIDGATSRTLLVVDDPDTVAAQAVGAGAKETSPVGDEHGWRVGRIIDPFGHEWEIGKPLVPWPPTSAPVGSAAEDEPRVFRRGGISYLRVPATDPRRSAVFYEDVFGWTVDADRDDPSFADGTGHVIGHFMTDVLVAGEAGVLPYVFVEQVDETLAKVVAHGGEVVTPPYPEGDLQVATFRDPAGNVIGVWQQCS